jgi:LytS/YehU family sensor histidine kinase
MISTPNAQRFVFTSQARRAIPWLLGVALYAAMYTTAVLLASDDTMATALRWAAVNVLPEMALAPFVIAMTRRNAWGTVSVARFAGVHALGAIGFAAFSVAIWLLALRFLPADGPQRPNPAIVVWKCTMTLLVYAALCGIGQALGFAARAREAAARAARAETLQMEARLAALRAQLNPHFVMNLLHSLVGVVGRDPALASRMLERLGDVLRYVVRVQRQDVDLVPLRDEWRFVEDYLSLEGLRLRERLRARLEPDATAFATAIPPFVIQPLVENAVRHAIAPRAAGGSVVVRSAHAGADLHLVVEDDGPGASADVAVDGARGGLRLVRERLLAIYGDRARLTLGRSDLGGLRVEIMLPAVTAAERDE